jgi:tetratricopeptide (TPR) repeat protein
MSEGYALLDQHLAEGNLDQAESVARHILSADPEDVVARVGLARVDAARGEFDYAMTELKALVSENPREPEPLAYLGVLTSMAGDQAQALKLAQRSIQLGGRVPAALCLVGDELLHEGRLDEALQHYDAALERSPMLSGAWLGRGRILAFKEMLGEAEDAYIQSVEYGPQRVEAWVELVQLEREGGAHEVAQENLALALRAHPGHPDLLALARTDDDDGDEVDQAIVAVRRAIYRQDHAGALLHLDELVESHLGDPRVAIAKAEVAVVAERGDIPAIVHELNRLVRDRPTAWEPKTALGRLLLVPSPVQNPKMGAAHCEDAWRTSGEHPHAGVGLMEAWAALGKLAHARALALKISEGEGPEAEFARIVLEGEID